MSFIDVPPFYLPYHFPGTVGLEPVARNVTLNHADDRFGWAFQIPKTGTLKAVGFKIGSTVTTAEDLRVTFQDLDASGNPDGTEDQYRVVAKAGISANTWITTGIMSSDGSDSGTKRSVTKGDWLSIIIRFDSAVGNLTIGGFQESTTLMNNPYTLFSDNGGAYAKNAFPTPMGFALQYNDDNYYVIECNAPYLTTAIVNYASTSTPDERGMIFQFPFQYRVAGVVAITDVDDTGDLRLYDSDGSTVLASVTPDPDYKANGTFVLTPFIFASDIELDANTNYRVSLRSTGSGLKLGEFDVGAAAVMGMFPGGTNVHFTSRSDLGSWSQTTTKRPFMFLIVNGLDSAAASGGGGQLINAGLVS
jgi:hypothetical protein